LPIGKERREIWLKPLGTVYSQLIRRPRQIPSFHFKLCHIQEKDIDAFCRVVFLDHHLRQTNSFSSAATPQILLTTSMPSTELKLLVVGPDWGILVDYVRRRPLTPSSTARHPLIDNSSLQDN
jgi:hypothetical protein